MIVVTVKSRVDLCPLDHSLPRERLLDRPQMMEDAHEKLSNVADTEGRNEERGMKGASKPAPALWCASNRHRPFNGKYEEM